MNKKPQENNDVGIDSPKLASLPPPKPRKPRADNCKLKTLGDIQNELSRLYRQARGGQVEPADAGKFCYLLQILAKITTDSDLEKRLDALEATHDSIKNAH
jgi:hypothetical protein